MAFVGTDLLAARRGRRILRLAPAAAALPLIVAALTGCGGVRPPADELQEGAQLFRASCSACHTLASNPHPSPVGGSLRPYRMTIAQVESFTRVMPLRRPLDDRQLRILARYVTRVQRAAPPRTP